MKTAKYVWPTQAMISNLLVTLKRDIGDEYRATDDSEDDQPGMCVTVGADGKGRGSWAYQTGDNSYTGGAYHYPHWAVIYLYRDSNCTELAKDAINQLGELVAY